MSEFELNFHGNGHVDEDTVRRGSKTGFLKIVLDRWTSCKCLRLNCKLNETLLI